MLHAVVFAFLYWLAFSIHKEFSLSDKDLWTLQVTLPGVVLIQTIVFYYAGHCHRSWHSVSFSDLVMLFHSATLSWLIIAALDHLFVSQIHPPRTVLVLDWGMIILVLGAMRAATRLSREELGPRLWRSGYRKATDRGRQPVGRNAGPAPALRSPFEIPPHRLPRSGRFARRIDALGHSDLGPAVTGASHRTATGRGRHSGHLGRADRVAVPA